MFLRIVIDFRMMIHFKRKNDRITGSFVDLTFHLDRTAHQSHRFLDDRKSQSHTVNTVQRNMLFLRIWFKCMTQEFLFHSNTGIFGDKFKPRSLTVASQFFTTTVNGSALFVIFDRIAVQIQQDS